MEFNAENRSANIAIRCCSFCRRPGHIINNCNSGSFIEFERRCFNEIENAIRNYQYPKQEFCNWLFTFSIDNQNLIKAFAISKLGIIIRGRRIADIVNDMCNYYCLTYHIPIEREQLNTEIVAPYNDSFEERPYLQRSVPILQTLPEPQNLGESQNLGEPQTLQDILNNIRFDDHLDNIIDSLIFLNAIGSLGTSLQTDNNTFEPIDIILNDCIDEKINECYICYEEKDIKNFIKLNCNHQFCKNCIIILLAHFVVKNKKH